MSAIEACSLQPLDALVSGATTILFDPGNAIVDQLRDAQQHFEATDVCLDFTEIETVSSEELSALIRFALGMRQREKSVAIRNACPHLEEIFEITRFAAWITD